QAKAHLDRLGSGEVDNPDSSAVGVDAVGELFLDWTSREPSLCLQIDTDVVTSVVADWDVPKTRFDVDGTPVCAWLRQGGRWQVKTRQRIAWDASVLLLSSTDGRYVEEFDLIDVGLGEDVLVFDLSGSGRMLGAREWLDPQREYAIAYDDSLNL